MVKFTACKFLDFSDNYTAKKQFFGSSLTDGKVFWLRKILNEGDPAMVQFCKKRGRINSPEGCTSERLAKCRDYVEFEHEVDDSTITL